MQRNYTHIVEGIIRAFIFRTKGLRNATVSRSKIHIVCYVSFIFRTKGLFISKIIIKVVWILVHCKMETQVLISGSYEEKYERSKHVVGISMWHLNIQPEHVHCVVGIKLSMSPVYALQILKGVSARLFFRNNPRQDKICTTRKSLAFQGKEYHILYSLITSAIIK